MDLISCASANAASASALARRPASLASQAAARTWQLVADVLRGPGRFDRVDVAQVLQHPVGYAPDVGGVGRSEGGEGLVPGGPQVRGGGDGFGADRVGGVMVAGQFPPGADGGGTPLRVELVQRIFGHRPRAVTAHGRACSAACSPIRSLRASISAAI